MVNITKGKEARDKLFSGIEEISNAVASTFGPYGNNVMIERPGRNPHITKDGVTVAKHIVFSDPVKDMGASLIREVTQKTADQVGDGTTSTAIITHAILKNIFEFRDDQNSRKTIQELKDAEKMIIEEIKKHSVEIKKENFDQMVFNVAKIAANNNPEIAQTVTEAYKKTGDKGFVNVREGKNTESQIIHHSGYIIKSGYESNAFINDYSNHSCTFEDAKVLISADPIKESSSPYLIPIIEDCFRKGKKVFIICDEIEPGVLSLFSGEGNNKHMCVILASGYGDLRFERLYDIAAVTGGKVLREKDGRRYDNFSIEDLGEVKKVICYKDQTVLIGLDENNDEVKKRIDFLDTEIENLTNEMRIDQTKERLAVLTGGVVTIEVGANTETEMKEKKDLYDDSVLAVKAALKEGIVPGGGCMLSYIGNYANNLPLFVSDAINSPFDILNSNIEDKGINQKWDQSPHSVIDILDIEDPYKADFIEAGICDPTSVVISSVKNAFSIAITVISTENILSLEQ